MKVVYVAHPLGAGEDREKNRANAAKWAAWVAVTFCAAPVADWIILSGEWPETDANRAFGLSIDKELISRCDMLVLCGGRVSPGMSIEMNAAMLAGKPVIDLTYLGYTPPVRP